MPNFATLSQLVAKTKKGRFKGHTIDHLPLHIWPHLNFLVWEIILQLRVQI